MFLDFCCLVVGSRIQYAGLEGFLGACQIFHPDYRNRMAIKILEWMRNHQSCDVNWRGIPQRISIFWREAAASRCSGVAALTLRIVSSQTGGMDIKEEIFEPQLASVDQYGISWFVHEIARYIRQGVYEHLLAHESCKREIEFDMAQWLEILVNKKVE